MAPKNSSFADIVLDTEKLLAACTVNAALLPGVRDLSEPLAQVFTRLKEVSVTQQNLTAERQKSTQELRALVAQTRELGIVLRSRVRGVLGPRTEKLVEFQIQPLRPTRRRKPPAPAPVLP